MLKLGVTMLVFKKNWQGIGVSPVRNEFHSEAKNVVVNDVYLGYERWKHQNLWRENDDGTMSSENSQGYLWIPWLRVYSSLANQIMCNKWSALEFIFFTGRNGVG